MKILQNVPLQNHNTFHIVAKAHKLVRIQSVDDVHTYLHQQPWPSTSVLVLGGGSNMVLTGDVSRTVLKMEIDGIALVGETDKAWIVQAGAGVVWHDLVRWTLDHGYYGLENMALIPGTVGASPVQNIGAYGVELQDRFESLDAIDLQTGQMLRMDAAACGFGYRDSVFKHRAAKDGDMGLAERALITHVRFALPKAWRPELGYADLERKMAQTGITNPSAQQIFDWVCEVRRAKLPDPAVIGNAGSFFKNPTVSWHPCQEIIGREPNLVYHKLHDGNVKLAAGWLIDACGWKGKTIGHAGVYEKQALVLINKGGATGGEVMTLAKAIQTSVYERFGLMLEPEPVVV